MPVRETHHARDISDVLIWNPVVKKIAHRIDEHALRAGPAERITEFLWHEAEIEAVLEGVARHTAKAFRESLSVTMRAAWTDLGAAADGVPCCIRPFDFGLVAHGWR